MIQKTSENWVAYIFKRSDGMFMIDHDEQYTMERERWSKWTDDPFKASRFASKLGDDWDHRWEDMVGDAVPVKVKGKTSHIVEIAE
jgi:hypothetical protein